MLYRSKAPFRLGIAGGGTDVSPYSNLYGGAILNVTVNLYAHATIRPLDNGKIRFVHINENITEEFDAVSELPLDGPLVLQHGIYNSIASRYNNGEPLSFELITQMDVPSGSGLGTSSTLVVDIEQESRRILRFNEKQYCESGLINGGIYLINRNELDGYPAKFSLEKDFFEAKVTTSILSGYISEGYFIDIGIPNDYTQAQTDFKDGRYKAL